MSQRFVVLCSLFCLFLAGLFVAPSAKAQTSASATVVGTVTDQSNAAIPNATITLTDVATNISQTATSNASGQYTFPTVTPGTYKVQVTKQGFKNSAVQNLVVDVAKSYTVNVAMQVGEVSQSVTVEASSAVQLETNTAQVSGVVTSQEMNALPTLNHDAQELINFQPSVQPGNGSFPTPMARISGAIDDQNTITLDGIDISDNLVGNGSWIPTSLDSVQEFDVGITNPNATFGRSSGGQIALYGKHGTNQYHGTAYWYTQNSALNANSWDLNAAGQPQAHLDDNRGGVAFGGPIIKNKTFVFANYELDRFPQSDEFTKTVPTANLKAGILTFKDGAGTIQTYDLKAPNACGGAACDPRGLGISPTVQAFWSLLPAPNVATGIGDGLNTSGFRGTAPAPLQTDNGVLRLDHNFNDRWRFSGSYDYFRSIQTGNGTQFDVLNPASPIALGGVFLRAVLASGQLTTQITPNLTNTFRFGWVRNWQNTPVVTPEQSAAEFAGLSSGAVTGTASGVGSDPFIAINPAEGLVSSPIENSSANARFQDYFERSIQFSDSIDWVKGKHSMEFGTDDRHLPLLTDRADKVVNGISSLVTIMDSQDGTGAFVSIPAADEPPLCATPTSPNCLPASQAPIWNQLYAGSLGLIDNTSILAVRDGSLNPLPFGTPLSNNTVQNQFYFYGQDVWRLTNSLTVSYGLSYGWQTAPSDTLGRQTILINDVTGQPLSAPSYISQKMSDAEQGTIFNPTQGYEPVHTAGKPVFNTDWGDVAPRVSVAWNPGASEGFLGRFLGDRKTVIRAGYSMVYDRESTIETVVIPMLGVGFGQTISSDEPTCPTCAASSNPAASDFRVGVDGNIPVPTVPTISNPVVPSVPFGELLSFQDDPNFKVGRTNAFDLDIQRELPHSMLLEVGYIGHRASRLPSSMDIDAAPFMFKDTTSGQTFAQAFDTVGHALEAGQPVTAQPFFENQLPGFANATCGGGTNTACLVSGASTAFTTGLVNSVFQTMDLYRLGQGLPTYDNLQAALSELRTYIGTSTYNGLIVSLQKKTSAGLTFGVNYTLSKSLDQGLVNQDNAGFYLNSFNVNASYGPSIYDRRSVLNADYVYQLPIGNGHRFHFNNGFDRALSGWYWSGIFTAYTGLPDVAGEGSQVWGGSPIIGGNVAGIPTVPSSRLNAGVHKSPGGGLNIFADPGTAITEFRNVNISTDGRDGDANPFRGLGLWNYDMTVGKSTAIRESVKLDFTAQFLNVFNHVNFQTPGLPSSNAALSLQSPSNFGDITNQFVPTNRTNGARWIELGLRLNF
ncbi:MAG TPA: carboxypeptidase-like regulatory domain-containing protein [Candidatus Acidoferrales bacterium]|nr:carboxypeptidase-like regulatory domain-containing protein [Candidatus Acidoferrales bacterium]